MENLSYRTDAIFIIRRTCGRNGVQRPFLTNNKPKNRRQVPCLKRHDQINDILNSFTLSSTHFFFFKLLSVFSFLSLLSAGQSLACLSQI
jgi:hypothetical protein